MKTSGTIKQVAKIGLASVALAFASACATSDDMDARFAKLEAKVNQALQASASAKIDATTALDVAMKKQR